jgi:hypothetical protein
MFPVRYELNFYINLLRNSVFKGLMRGASTARHHQRQCMYICCENSFAQAQNSLHHLYGDSLMQQLNVTALRLSITEYTSHRIISGNCISCAS